MALGEPWAFLLAQVHPPILSTPNSKDHPQISLVSPPHLKGMTLLYYRPFQARDYLGALSFHLQHLAAFLTHSSHSVFVE